MKSWAAYSKEHPGEVKVAHSGVGAGNHLTELVLSEELGLEWKIVAYNGGSDAIRAVVSGECDVILNGAAATLPYVVQDQLKGLAVTGSTRLTDLPDMPTFAELELPEAEGGSWQGLLATAGTPDAIIAQVNEAIAQIVQMEDVQQSILNLGAVVSTGTPKSWTAGSTRRDPLGGSHRSQQHFSVSNTHGKQGDRYE